MDTPSVDMAIEEALSRVCEREDVLFVDIRRDEEVGGKTARGALTVPRDMLEIEITRRGVDSTTRT